MYAVLTTHIRLGEYSFEQVSSLRIARSIDGLGDTAIVKMPTSFILGNKDEGFRRKVLDQSVKVGDQVSIKLGYKGIYEGQEFTGYITRIKPSIPLEIYCKDAMWLLRQKSCNKFFEKTTLRGLLNYIVDGTGVSLNAQVPSISFDSFVMRNINGAQALQKLKETYGLVAYIDNDGGLFVGLRSQLGTGVPVIYHLEKNVTRNDLYFKEATQQKLRVKAIGYKSDNTKIDVEVGDKEGVQRTYIFMNISDKEQLKRHALAKLEKTQKAGLEGALHSFLHPFVDRSMAVEVRSDRYPQFVGVNLVDKVITTYGQQGARRQIYIGHKLGAQ